jgi:hypothetical protein
VTAGAQQRHESSKNPKGQDVEEQSTCDSGVCLEQLQEELTCVVRKSWTYGNLSLSV